MEVLGGVVLWDTVKEVQKFAAKYKRAPQELKEYLISLESLSHVSI